MIPVLFYRCKQHSPAYMYVSTHSSATHHQAQTIQSANAKVFFKNFLFCFQCMWQISCSFFNFLIGVLTLLAYYCHSKRSATKSVRECLKSKNIILFVFLHRVVCYISVQILNAFTLNSIHNYYHRFCTIGKVIYDIFFFFFVVASNKSVHDSPSPPSNTLQSLSPRGTAIRSYFSK